MTIFLSNQIFSNNEIPNIYLINLQLSGTDWSTAISQEEYDQCVQNGAFEGRPTYGFTALLMPIRNHRCKFFLEDLALPAVFNLALKVDDLVPRIFAVFFALCVDVTTLPIRLLTAIPRLFHKQPEKEEHPFYKLLQAKGCDQSLLDQADSCDVKLMRINKQMFAETPLSRFWFDIDGVFSLKDNVWTTYKAETFSLNFFEKFAFIVRSFTNFSSPGGESGINRGHETYNTSFLKAHPYISKKQFEKIERQWNDHLKLNFLSKTPAAHEFLEELRAYIPETIETIQNARNTAQSYQSIRQLLKKAYQAFALKCHPDKGGDKETFVRIKDKWEKLQAGL